MNEFLGGFGVLFDPHVIIAFGLYYFAMALISGMPEPTTEDTRNYRWAYRSAHIFAANVSSAVNKKFGVETVTTEVKLTETVRTENKGGEPPKEENK